MKVTGLRYLARGTWSKFTFGLPILRAKVTGRPIPFQVQFTLTNRCNLKCSYCYADYPNRPSQELTTAQVFTVIDQFVALGTRRFNLVGGEPMIRQDLEQIIDHIKGQGAQCAMTTNGYYARRRLPALEKLDLLCVSLDGQRQAHDACRGAGSYDQAIEAIRLAREVGTPLQIACVLTKHNLNSIEYLLEMGRQVGFSVGFSTLISKTGTSAQERPPYLPTDEECRRALRRIINLKKQGYPVLFSQESLTYALNWKHDYCCDKIIGREPDFDYIACHAGKYFAIIDANGDVYPCPAMVDILEPLNVLRDGAGKALAHAGNHPCKTCHIPCMNDFNLLYSLRPAVVLNVVRNYRVRPRQGRPLSKTPRRTLPPCRALSEPLGNVP
jgi:MoaA/NifB/PqqE/SkfB family radical SAM enzyme